MDASETDFQIFWAGICQPSMFKQKRLVFLENVFANPDFKNNLAKNIKDLAASQDVLVVVEKAEIKKNDKLFVVLLENSQSQEFLLLTGLKLCHWIKEECFQHRAEIEDEALEGLINTLGNDLWRLSNEIAKMAAFTKKITTRTILSFLEPKLEAEIFKTIDALASRNKKQALHLLQKHLFLGDNPLYLLSMVNYQFRNLVFAKTILGGINLPIKIHPFVLRKAKEQARKFSWEELQRIYQQIFVADFDIKTGKVTAEEGLKMLLAEV